MSAVNAGCPVTPHATAPVIPAARPASPRTAGTARAAAVVVASPAASCVANATVRPSGLTYEPLARYARSAAVSVESGRAPRGGPYRANRAAYPVAVRDTSFGLNGPETAVNSRSPASHPSAAATGPGAAQTGVRSRSTISVGFTAVCGKCRASSESPYDESLPAGAVTGPPKPATRYPPDSTASAPNTTRPVPSTSTGRRTSCPHARPHKAGRTAPGRTDDGQNAAAPRTASSAGSSVSQATSISPMPIDSGAARPEYRENVASASDPSAAISTPAENVIVSPV